MAKLSVISRIGSDKTKDAAHTTYANAKDGAKATSRQVQDNVKTGVRRARGLLALVAAISGFFYQKNLRDARKGLKQAQKQVSPMRDSIQDGIATGLDKTQKTMQLGKKAAQKLYAQNARATQKNLKKARKNLRGLQESLQASVVPAVATGLAAGLAKTQDVLHKGSEKAGQGLQQISSGARGMKESVQDQYSHYQHKRHRARSLFRWGLIAGVALALLFTPLAGSEVRQRLAEQWQRYRGYIGA